MTADHERNFDLTPSGRSANMFVTGMLVGMLLEADEHSDAPLFSEISSPEGAASVHVTVSPTLFPHLGGRFVFSVARLLP